jgi:hypothetical protein
MLKKILIAVVVLVAGLLAFATTMPDTFSVQRSAVINAPPEKITPLLADFRQWSSWSPFEKADPTMKRTYAGADRGKGALYGWEGNAKVGAGRMEILDASHSRVAIKLDFLKPFEAHNLAEFTLQPNGNTTTVTWSMRGRNPFISKVICVFISMDKMVGGDFETGLQNLKTLAENKA